MFDFPNAPTVGQRFPATPTTGVPTYTWDGAKWTTIGAPLGGKTPVYTDGSNPMAATLTLSGDPVNPTDAADKHYVDNAAPPPFPSGTVMVFYQAAAPTGWTKLTTQNDKALRVVSGNGGVAGGTNAFSTVQAQSVVGNHTLNTNEIPPGIGSSQNVNITVYPAGNSGYNLPISNGGAWQGQVTAVGGVTTNYTPYSSNGNTISYTANVSGNNNIGVYSNGGGGAHNHPITMDIQYVDVILASKN
jgi:hypothetical protein